VFASATESCRTSGAPGERINDIEFHLNDGDYNQLRDALERFELEKLITAIPYRDEDLSLVVRVDQANQIAENDTVFVAQSRARQYHCRQPGIGKMYCNPARNKLCLARDDRERFVNAGAKVKTCRSRRRVRGQLVIQARVKDTDIYLRHAVSADTVSGR
jgi:hypothetical protein